MSSEQSSTSAARHRQKQLYHVDQSVFTKDKPDLTFHRGTDTNSPVVAVSHLPKLSTGCKIGLGDPAVPDSVIWEDMIRESVNASEYRWSMVVPGAGRRKFVWKRTHNVGADGSSPSAVTLRNFKLLDLETEQLLAVFTSDRGWSSCGVLQINVEYGDDFDVMVTATCLSLYEKARKRAARSSAGHGGGP